MKVRLLIAIAASTFASAAFVSIAADEKAKEKSAQEILDGRKELKLMTPNSVRAYHPRSNPGFCAAMPDPDEIKKKLGPHFDTSLKIYMSAEAAEIFGGNQAKEAKDHKPYPEGAVVLKEKIKNGKTTAWGGMIKRTAGYDKDHGDWEFFYVEDGKKLETGKLTNCIDCHNAVAEKDHVYGYWAPKKSVKPE